MDSQSQTPPTASHSPPGSNSARAAKLKEAGERLKEKVKRKDIHYPFWFGGSASAMATCFTHPLDLVKVRLQMASSTARSARPTMLGTFLKIVRNEGFPALYSGLSASLLRQATYSTTRFGVYEELKSHFPRDHKPSFLTLVFLASISGAAGGLAGNPADIINVRMQQDRANPPHKRRNYKNALDGLIRMARDEGAASLFRGVWPNTLRAVLMTASQLASYDQFKALLLGWGGINDGLATHFAASFLSGFVATTICSPVDVIKTRIMSSHNALGISHLLKETFRREGYTWMFKGWIPSFTRLGPQTILTFIFMEQHRKTWRMLYPEENWDSKGSI